jgi:putative addiction module component (TIGR02574 family)
MSGSIQGRSTAGMQSLKASRRQRRSRYAPAMTLEDIWKEVLRLPAEARAKLAGDILESLDDEQFDQDNVDAAWDDEIKRRVEEIESGAVKGVPWSEVQQKARQTLNKARGR